MAGQKPLLYDHPGSICSQMARLALVEKEVDFERRTIDIMEKAEQFEPWYTALNPRAVVPTLQIGEEIVTDTINIVRRVDAGFDGPGLVPGDPSAAERMSAMMRDVMGLHYGVLLYSRRTAEGVVDPTIAARGRFLRAQLAAHPERAELLQRRIDGNVRLQTILADRQAVTEHINAARALVARLDAALSQTRFVCGPDYTLADCFASAALARFRLHGFQSWWSRGANAFVANYYERMAMRPSWLAAGVVDTGGEAGI